MKTVRLITCENDAQAHILQGALENEGIPAILHNEITARVLNGLSVIWELTFWFRKPITTGHFPYWKRIE